jgi:hypothetical protein
MHLNYDYYQNFAEEQFAADEFFRQWVLSPDREKGRFWNTYLHLYPGQRNPFLAGRRHVKELEKTGYYKRPLSVTEKQAMKEDLFRYFELKALPIPPICSSKVLPIPGRKALRRSLAAAAVGLIALLAWWLCLS